MGKSHSEFNIGATDSGLCHILNGEDMRSTFAGTDRMKDLWESLDKRQGGNSIETFLFEKDSRFHFDSVTCLNYHFFLTFSYFFNNVGNFKPKLKWFFKPKLKPKTFSIELSPSQSLQNILMDPGRFSRRHFGWTLETGDKS